VTAIARWLAGLGAQYDVVQFFEPYGSNWAKAWAELPRGDWMLGIAARLADDAPALVRAASACARVAIREGGDSGDALRAIEMAEEWATLGGSTSRLNAEAERLEGLAEGASSAAERSVLLAAAGACRAASDPTYAVSSALQAVEAAVDARASEDPMKVIGEVQSACARAVRTHLPTQVVRSPFGG
jgi:hypothetical protein